MKDQETRHRLEEAAKALWANDIRHAYHLFKSIKTDPNLDPLLDHDLTFNLAVLGTMLGEEDAQLQIDKLEKLYDNIQRRSRNLEIVLPSKGEPKSRIEVRKMRFKRLPPEERLAYLLSPIGSLKQLHQEVEFVRGLNLPEVRSKGRIKYSLENNLTSVEAKCYLEGEFNLSRLSTLSDISNLREESDLVAFRFRDLDAEVIVRKTGVAVISIPYTSEENLGLRVDAVLERITGMV